MTGRSAWIRLASVAVVAGALGTACTDSLTDVDSQLRVTVTPEMSTLASIGEQIQLTATVDVTSGAAPTPLWTTRNVDVAAVGDDGRVRAIGNGETWVLAVVEAGGLRARDSVRIVVSQVPTSVQVQRSLDTLTWLGQTTVLTAVASDALGHPVEDARFAWVSSDPTRARVDTAGMVTAMDNGPATISASLGDVTASVAVAVAQQVTSVTVTPTPASILVGATQQFAAEAKDAGGTPVTGVKFLWVSANDNVAVVDTTGLATGKGAGTATITAVGRGQPGNAVLTVGPSVGVPTQLAFSVQPATSVAGQALSPAVEVELRDANGLLVTSARNAVTLAIGTNPGSGALSGTKTVAAVNGIASFSGLSINKTGTGYALAASATGLTGASSDGFNITPAAPVKLAFGTQPTDAEGNVVIAPSVTVRILDQFDNVVTGATNAITVGIGVNPWASIFSAGGTLSGTKTVNAAAGIATFSTLKIDKPGPGYTLTASASGLTSATSDAFGVNLTVQVLAGAEGGSHTCAITTGGTYCWGYNGYGQLGDGTFASDSVPRLVSGGFVFTKIAGGAYHTCALTAAGAAYCWGNNDYGQVGDNSNTLRMVPVAVNGSLTFTSITAGAYHSCGVTGTDVYCWGNDYEGELGNDGSFTPSNVPVKVAGTTQWAAVTAGNYHTCGRTTGGDAYCWGWDGYGQLGNDNAFSGTVATPVAVRDSLGAAKTWKAIEGGIYHTCGIDANDAAFCWGRNGYGQLGVDTTKIAVGTNKGTPVTVFGSLTFARIRASGNHSCGTTISGDTYCWGYNFEGQLGSGTTGDRMPLRTLVTGGHTFTSLTDGGSYMCAMKAGGEAWCWGYNGNGQLGDGSRQARNAPAQIVQ